MINNLKLVANKFSINFYTPLVSSNRLSGSVVSYYKLIYYLEHLRTMIVLGQLTLHIIIIILLCELMWGITANVISVAIITL